MIKSVTRTLYIDGKPIAEYTQDPMADSELADIEQIAARMELVLDERGLRGINVMRFAWDDDPNGDATDEAEQLTAKEIRERFEKVKREMGLG